MITNRNAPEDITNGPQWCFTVHCIKILAAIHKSIELEIASINTVS